LLTAWERQAQRLNPPDNTELSHQIAPEIWEWIVGDLRVPYFFDGGRIIVCTHGFLKKGRKTKQADIDRATRERERYFGAQESRSIVLDDEVATTW
jgi:phage-related protein